MYGNCAYRQLRIFSRRLLFVRHSKTVCKVKRGKSRLTDPLFLPAEGAVKVTRNAYPGLLAQPYMYS
jgi:hypothetical protein